MRLRPRQGEPLSPVEIENELVRLANDLETLTDKMVKKGIEVGHKEIDYKKARATAVLKADGKNADQRDANASLACAEEFSAFREATAVYDAMRDKSYAIRYQIEVLRSLAANVRHQTG